MKTRAGTATPIGTIVLSAIVRRSRRLHAAFRLTYFGRKRFASAAGICPPLCERAPVIIGCRAPFRKPSVAGGALRQSQMHRPVGGQRTRPVHGLAGGLTDAFQNLFRFLNLHS